MSFYASLMALRNNRRQFLKTAAGVFVPAWFGIAKADIFSGPIMRPMATSAGVIPTPTCFWTLNESSAGTGAVTRADSVGGQDLTDNSLFCASDTGVISLAAKFVAANGEFLSHTSNATLNTGDIDFTIAAWVYMDTKSANMDVVSKYLTTGNNRAYELQYTQSVDRFRFIVSPDGTSSGLGIVAADTFGSPSTATWYLVIAWHTNGSQIGIQVMGAASNTTAYTTGVFDTSTADFKVGNSTSTLWNGRIDEVGLWKGAALDSTQRDYIYNAGAGRASPYW
jgi:hypothetical protein